MSVPELHPPNRKRHPDGVHRDYWKRPIYLVPGDDSLKTKCGWTDETGRHGCNAHVAGGPYQRVTTFVGVLEDTFRLEKWAKRNVAIGLALADHLVLKVAGQINPDNPHENRDAIDAICEEAENMAKASAGADSGTALHLLTERIDRGERAAVPKANKPDIAAYQKLLTDHELRIAEIEIAVVIDNVRPTTTAHGIGGRFDRIIDHWVDPVSPWPCPTCGKRRRIVDLKTQKTMEWGEGKTAMQLCCYALGKRYDPVTGERADLDVCQCRGYVLHVPVGQGQAELYRADLIRAKDMLSVAYEAWRARGQKGLLEPVQIPDAAASTTPAAVGNGNGGGELDIHGLIAMAADRESLLAIWRQAKDAGTWASEHELAAKRRLAELEGKS